MKRQIVLISILNLVGLFATPAFSQSSSLPTPPISDCQLSRPNRWVLYVPTIHSAIFTGLKRRYPNKIIRVCKTPDFEYDIQSGRVRHSIGKNNRKISVVTEIIYFPGTYEEASSARDDISRYIQLHQNCWACGDIKVAPPAGSGWGW